MRTDVAHLWRWPAADISRSAGHTVPAGCRCYGGLACFPGFFTVSNGRRRQQPGCVRGAGGAGRHNCRRRSFHARRNGGAAPGQTTAAQMPQTQSKAAYLGHLDRLTDAVCVTTGDAWDNSTRRRTEGCCPARGSRVRLPERDPRLGAVPDTGREPRESGSNGLTPTPSHRRSDVLNSAASSGKLKAQSADASPRRARVAAVAVPLVTRAGIA